jgi:hypothetical protein
VVSKYLKINPIKKGRLLDLPKQTLTNTNNLFVEATGRIELPYKVLQTSA